MTFFASDFIEETTKGKKIKGWGLRYLRLIAAFETFEGGWKKGNFLYLCKAVFDVGDRGGWGCKNMKF